MELAELYEHFVKCNHVSTDTRKINEGDIFFALRGPNFNGNAFAREALENGASLAVIDDTAYQKDDRYIIVNDVLSTLQQLANYHRRQFDIPFIALTGSNGKTTTKELIREVLATKYKTASTAGNFNNHIGVPLTLLSLTQEVEMVVVEMGANKPGDIKTLSEIAEPNYGLITNIGKAHLEGFGGFDGVLKTKSELYHYLIQNNGTIFVNSSNPILLNMSKRMKNPIFYPNEGDFFHCTLLHAGPFVTYKTESGNIVKTQLPGQYNFENIATALCIGKYFEVPENRANEAIQTYTPSNNRSQLIHKNGNTIILDAYNANPDSMKEAIQNFETMSAPQKVLILGDMLELGEEAIKEHKELGKLLAQSSADKIYLFGEQIKPALEVCPGALYFDNKEDLIQALEATSFNDALILIKASRSLGLESITKHIT